MTNEKMNITEVDYFCCRCGLLYEHILAEGKGILCVNENCESHISGDLYILRSGTIKFEKMLRSKQKIFQRKAWSSLQYVNEQTVKRYRTLGVRIKEGELQHDEN